MRTLRTRTLQLAALGVAGGLLLAACGGGATKSLTSQTTTSAGGQATATTGGQGQGIAKQGNNADQGDSEFGLPEADIIKKVDAVESSISGCMQSAGFEYVPVDYATARRAMDSNSKPNGLTADEFRAQFGYGLATLYGGVDTQSTMGLGRNVAIRDALPATDRVAWERQLLGTETTQTFVVGLDNEDLSRTGGCTRAAVKKSFSAAELGAGFVSYQNDQGARVDQDPRVIAAYRDWAVCMRDAGYSYDNTDAIKVDIATRLDAITKGIAPDQLAKDKAEALNQLQGEEKAIAAADKQCELSKVSKIKTQVETELLGPAANN